jgi:predicted protein tyrosine phosphatase
MSDFLQRLIVCGADDIDRYRSRQITHALGISNPGNSQKPAWFEGEHRQLWFGDVSSEQDAVRCKTRAATPEDLRQGLAFLRHAWLGGNSRVAIYSDQGASRAPALAYVFIAEQLGPGSEAEAFKLVMRLRPNAAPNKLVVKLGDTLLRRNGALFRLLDGALSAAKAPWRSGV